MKCIFYTIAVLSLLTTSVAYSQSTDKKQSLVIAKGATVTKAGDGYSFTEGPAVDPEGNVFFTDQPNDKILRWSVDGTISVFMEGAGRSNGLYFDNDGNLLSCADLNNELWLIDKTKKVTVLVKDFEGKKLNGPNDLWVDPKGGIYFTDPFYKREYWSRTEKEIEKENVYYLSPDKKTLKVAATDFVRPNGIVGSGDGKTLYVADINARKTYSFRINDDGTLTDQKLFAEMGSDGMTTDNKGNVYLTGKGVTVFDAAGKQIEHITIDAPWTANVCFGGKGQKTLFVTASKSVYTLKMKVKGVR
jgi:gluconolactonase